MAAATGEREAGLSVGRYQSYPMAESEKIWMGTNVVINAAGFAESATDATGKRFAGTARETVDNTLGANGDLRIEVWREGVFSFKGTAFTAADLGAAVYVDTDQDVGLYDNVDYDILVGTIEEVVASTDVRVRIQPHALPSASGLASVAADLDTAEATLATVVSDLDTAEAQVAALGAEDTDGVAFIFPSEFRVVSGTWTLAEAGDVETLTRTAHADAQVIKAPISLPTRAPVTKGRKLLSVDVIYAINTADLDDVLVEVIQTTLNGDNAIPTATVIAGDVNGDYDANHDNAGKRGDDTGAPEQHTLTVTLPAPDYHGTDEGLSLRITVDGDAGAAGVLTLYGAQPKFAQRLVDLA